MYLHNAVDSPVSLSYSCYYVHDSNHVLPLGVPASREGNTSGASKNATLNLGNIQHQHQLRTYGIGMSRPRLVVNGKKGA